MALLHSPVCQSSPLFRWRSLPTCQSSLYFAGTAVLFLKITHSISKYSSLFFHNYDYYTYSRAKSGTYTKKWKKRHNHFFHFKILYYYSTFMLFPLDGSGWFRSEIVEHAVHAGNLGDDAHKFQYTYMQFFVSGVLSLLLFAYCFTLPECKVVKREGKVSLAESFGLNAFKLFKTKKMALFFIFSALLGMCLQVTNGYAGPFITSFKGSADAAVASSFAANNATLLTSISQISEALCILMIPFFLKRFGIKVVMLMSMFAWVFRFGFFGLGNPAMPGVILFILSCVVYGVAFDFFNVSGGIFVDQECEPSVKASAQGLFMMMTNGVGATIGTLAAGEIVNHFCSWQDGYLQGNWPTCWFIFATFALIVGVSFALVFKPEKKKME